MRTTRATPWSGRNSIYVAISCAGLVLVSMKFDFRGDRRSRGFEDLRSCISRVPVQSMSSDISTKYLAQCAQGALPDIVGSPEAPLLMEWMLDANLNSHSLPFEVLKANLSAIAQAQVPAPVLRPEWIIALAFFGFALTALLRRPSPKQAIIRSERVLVVDDDREFCWTVAQYLRAKGVRVDIAITERRARQLLKYKNYSTIFCDFNLRRSNGLELCDSLKEEIRKRCVIVTGHSRKRVYGESQPRYKTLEKPCTGQQLLSMIG